jgi:hypothetical protein
MTPESTWTDAAPSDAEHISLCETLDRVLNKGVVVTGEVVISVADIDLIYLGLQLVLTSVETARKQRSATPIHIGARAEGTA